MSLRARLRAVAGDPLLVMSATVGGLLVLVPAIVLIALVATGHTGDRGGLVLLVGLLGAGGYVCCSTLGQAGTRAAPRRVVVTDSTGLYGRTVDLPEPTGRVMSAWRVVVVILAVLVVGSLGIAIVMSVLDDHLHGRPHLARVVVGLLGLVAVVGVGWVVRVVTTRRAPAPSRDRSGG